MPKPSKGPRLGGSPAHERIILANLASQLFEHGRITTTETRARRVQPVAEKLISKAKRGDLHSRRLVKQTITNSDIVHVLFAEIGPFFADRSGGYTRIIKVENRKGDNAPMAVIELVREPFSPKQATVKEAEAATKRAATKSAAPAAEAPVEAPAAAAPVAFVDGGFGADSAAPLEDGSAPEGFTVKGNKDSMKYHTAESPWYDATIAEVWFRTPEAAEAAGFEPAGGEKAQGVDEA